MSKLKIIIAVLVIILLAIILPKITIWACLEILHLTIEMGVLVKAICELAIIIGAAFVFWNIDKQEVKK